MAKTVCIAMSGGVDSSTSAFLLKESGYDVFGVFMKLWDDKQQDRGCCSLNDANDALRVCEKIRIPFYVLNLKQAFRQQVVQYFINEYLAGRTPNPCIYCNNKLKFDILMQNAKTFGANFLATGHYAKIKKVGDEHHLLKGSDSLKDQSYFLFGTSKKTLDSILFPLGELCKDEVRKIAERAGLITSKKRESQEICFVNDDYRTFLMEAGIAEKEGYIIDTKGQKLGRHKGYYNFTVGQRSGLNIAIGKPVYVLKVVAEENLVIVGDESELYKTTFSVTNCNFLEPLNLNKMYAIKIRYRHAGAFGFVKAFDSLTNSCVVSFQTPQRALTPGQAAVFYDGDMVVGGGWINDVYEE